jgi:hypothetical protein
LAENDHHSGSFKFDLMFAVLRKAFAIEAVGGLSLPLNGSNMLVKNWLY